MPQFIIHIGPHKTGTTYLQLGFRALRAELAANGTVFPEFWELAPGNPSHLPLTLALREGKTEILARQFADLIAGGAQRILISSEDLSNLDEIGAARLRRLTEGHAVQIVFYLRRWSELIPSSWQENIKQGRSITLPEFLLSHLQRPDSSRLLNFDLKLTMFAAIFGPSSLRLIAYNELREKRVDMFQHFAANFLDWADAPVPRVPRQANTSRDIKEVELLRTLNAMARAHDTGPADGLRRTFDRLRPQLKTDSIFSAMERHITPFRLNEKIPALARLHETLAKKYLPHTVAPKLPARLFRAGMGDLSYIATDYLAEAGTSAALRQIYDRVRTAMQDPAHARVTGGAPALPDPESA